MHQDHRLAIGELDRDLAAIVRQAEAHRKAEVRKGAWAPESALHAAEGAVRSEGGSRLEALRLEAMGSPAIWCMALEGPAPTWRAAFALELRLLQSSLSLDVAENALRERNWLARVIQCVMAGEAQRELEIRSRITLEGMSSDDEGSPTELLLVANCRGASENQAREAARVLWYDLRAVLAVEGSLGWFEAVERESDVRERLAAGDAQGGWELLRDGRRMHLADHPVGLRDRSFPVDALPLLVLPRPFSAQVGGGSEIPRTAATAGMPLSIHVRLEQVESVRELFETVDLACRVDPDPYLHLLRARLEGRDRVHGLCSMRVRITSVAPLAHSVAFLVGRALLGPDADSWRIQPWTPSHGAELPAAPATGEPSDRLSRLYLMEEASLVAPLLRWGLKWEGSRRLVSDAALSVPANLSREGLALGSKRVGRVALPVLLGATDRSRHVYIIGQTGTGKSTMMASMILSDVQEGAGVAVLDPHGDLVDSLLERIPPERWDDVILFDPADLEYPMGLNLLEARSEEHLDFLIQEALLMFYRLFDPNRFGMVGPQWEHWFRNAALALAASPPGGTLVDIPMMYTDEAFMRKRTRDLLDPIQDDFWNRQMGQTSAFHKSEMLNYFVSKFGRFRSNRMLRNIVGQVSNSFDFRRVMDERRIFLARLNRGKVGEINSSLLGTVLLTRLFQAALSREDLAPQARTPFHVYVDEFQLFTTDTLPQMVSESRKYGLSLCVAHQNTTQLEPRLYHTLLGNVGSLVAFRPGIDDAGNVETYFAPGYRRHDLMRLPNHQACARLLVDGRPADPFTFETLLPPPPSSPDAAATCRKRSRERYCRPRSLVEAEIAARLMG